MSLENIQRFIDALKPLERFFENVEITETCWLWTGSKHIGYGRIKINKKMYYAHRWFYEQVRGKIHYKQHIDHICRVPACVNPYHLEHVTALKNRQRGERGSAIYESVERCVRGHAFTQEEMQRERRRCSQCHRLLYAQRRKIWLASNEKGRKPRRLEPEKTHCVHEHALTDDNVFLNATGQKRCRICQDIANKKSLARKQAKKLKHPGPER